MGEPAPAHDVVRQRRQRLRTIEEKSAANNQLYFEKNSRSLLEQAAAIENLLEERQASRKAKRARLSTAATDHEAAAVASQSSNGSQLK